MTIPDPLPFEQDIHDLEVQLSRLEASPEHAGGSETLRKLRRELTTLKRERYANLQPWETILVARHKDRPQTLDYVDMVFDEFVELHGDRAFGDDRAIRTGFARLDGQKVMLIGQQKGRTTAERLECFYGCAHPEGYRKALGKMKLAAKYRLPVICLIDTPGAFPGIGAEERGQAQLIATSILEMSRLPTPIICVVIGEGGSGGALGMGWGSGGDSPVRVLLGDQPGRLRGDPLADSDRGDESERGRSLEADGRRPETPRGRGSCRAGACGRSAPGTEGDGERPQGSVEPEPSRVNAPQASRTGGGAISEVPQDRPSGVIRLQGCQPEWVGFEGKMVVIDVT